MKIELEDKTVTVETTTDDYGEVVSYTIRVVNKNPAANFVWWSKTVHDERELEAELQKLGVQT